MTALRSALRRRGDVLLDAIRAAARAELAEVGYSAFSIESVAGRARTGKASIYRHWGDKRALVLDAIKCDLPEPSDVDILDFVGRQTSTRDALLIVMRTLADSFDGERGEVFRVVATDCVRDAAFAELVETSIVMPRRETMLRLLEHGVARGEVRPGALTEQVTEVGPAVVMHAVLLTGAPPPDADLVSLVDNILMPIVAP